MSENKNNIVLYFYDKETNKLDFTTRLKNFISNNNYDDLDRDVENIKKAKFGDIVDIDHHYKVIKGKEDTFDSLVEEYNEFLEKHKLESCSASDLLAGLYFTHLTDHENIANYLETFIERWEKMIDEYRDSCIKETNDE